MCYIFFLIILGIILYSIFKEESHGSGTGSGNGTGTGSSASGTGTGSGTGSSASGTGSGRVTYTTGTATYSMGTGTNPGTGQQQQQQRPQQGMAANKKKSPTEGLIVYNLKHSPLQLGKNMTKGGEGLIYTIPEQPGHLIKLYIRCVKRKKKNAAQDPKEQVIRTERIRRMLQIKQELQKGSTSQSAANGTTSSAEESFRRLLENHSLAWPVMPVFGDKTAQTLIGYVMPRLEGIPLDSICSGYTSIEMLRDDKDRPWDRRHLVKASLNFVRKVRMLAELNILVNDFNTANFFVNPKTCRVSFIDCDSFQIPKAGGRGTICSRVLSREAVAPEILTGESDLDEPRDIYHVVFGVAIIVYYLLMVAHFPFDHFVVNNPEIDAADPGECLIKGYCPFVPHGFNPAEWGFSVAPEFRFPPSVPQLKMLWDVLPNIMKNCFLKTFCWGHSYSCRERRASLDELEQALIQTLKEMNDSPEMSDLWPNVPGSASSSTPPPFTPPPQSQSFTPPPKSPQYTFTPPPFSTPQTQQTGYNYTVNSGRPSSRTKPFNFSDSDD